MTSYTLSDGTNVLAPYDYIDYTLNSNNSYFQYIGVSGDELIFTGTYTIGGSNNSTLTFNDDSTGLTTVSTIVSISSTTLELTFNVPDSTLTANIRLVRF